MLISSFFFLSFLFSRSQGSLSRLDQDGPDGESTLSKMDIVLSFTLEVGLLDVIFALSPLLLFPGYTLRL